jgi:hypothetical protein
VRSHCFAIAAVVLLSASTLTAQKHEFSVQNLINATRQLAPDEVARVLDAVRARMAGKRGRFTTSQDDAAGRSGVEFVAGSNGHLLFLRSTGAIEGGIVGGDGTSTTWTREYTVITEFSGRPARACDGSVRPGELILQYYNDGAGWIPSARSDDDRRLPTPVFALLMGNLSVESGELTNIDGRSARAFTATRMLPEDMAYGPEYRSDDTGRPWTKVAPDERTQLRLSLWIDTRSLLPLLWEVRPERDAQRGIASRPVTHVSVHFADSVHIRRPSGIKQPDCIPPPPSGRVDR